MFETEKIAGEFTLNLLQVKEPQHCYRYINLNFPALTRILTVTSNVN